MQQAGQDKNWLVGKPHDDVAGAERGEDRADAAARARKTGRRAHFIFVKEIGRQGQEVAYPNRM